MNTKIAKKTNICQECTAYLPKDSSQCILCGHINKPTDGRVIQMPIQTGERSNREIYKSRELTIEEVKSLYFDPEALIEPAYRLYRIDSDSIRYYYTLDETIKPEFYTSVTSFIKLTVPPGIGLLKWMQSLTKESQERIVDESKAYGTFIDICFNQFLVDKSFELDGIRAMIKGYFAVNDFYVFNADLWEYFLKKDILAFAQFVKDYEVQPIAIGIPLVSFRHKIGGCLDLVCKMNDRLPTKTIKPKRVTAVVDYKSKIGSFKENGERNSFYEEHEIQLHVYRRLLRENFPKIRVQKLFNWSPKNWRGTPNYNVKDQTWVQSRLKIPHLLGLHKILMADKNPSVTIIDGRIEVGKSLEDNYKTYELNQFIINKHQAMKGERA